MSADKPASADSPTLNEDSFHALADDLQVPILQACKTENKCRGWGGYGHIYKGEARLGPQTVSAAIKVFHNRNGAAGMDQLTQSVIREARVWSRLQHANVLQFYGVALEPTHRVWLISPWIDNGDLWGYMNLHPEIDTIQMCRGIALGVEYLHSVDVIHGDIRCCNVLVERDGRPLLADFGLSRLVEELSPGDSPSANPCQGSTRWLAPERLDPKRFGLTVSTSHSTASDAYALGMTMYAIFALQQPYDDKRSDHEVESTVLEGTMVDHPGHRAVLRGMSTRIWEFMRETWNADRNQRPALNRALQTILFDSQAPISYDQLKGVTRRAHTRRAGQWVEADVQATELVYELENFGDSWFLGRTARGEKGVFPGYIVHLDEMTKSRDENDPTPVLARWAEVNTPSTITAPASNYQALSAVPTDYSRMTAISQSDLSGAMARHPPRKEPLDWRGKRIAPSRPAFPSRPIVSPSGHDHSGGNAPAIDPRQTLYAPPAHYHTPSARSPFHHQPGYLVISRQEEEKEESDDGEEDGDDEDNDEQEISQHAGLHAREPRYAYHQSQPHSYEPLARPSRAPRRQETIRGSEYDGGQSAVHRGYQDVQSSLYGQPMSPAPVNSRSLSQGSASVASFASGGPGKFRHNPNRSLNSMTGQHQPQSHVPFSPPTVEYPVWQPMQEDRPMYLSHDRQRVSQPSTMPLDHLAWPAKQQFDYASPGQGLRVPQPSTTPLDQAVWSPRQQVQYASSQRQQLPPQLSSHAARSDRQTHYETSQRLMRHPCVEEVPDTQYPLSQPGPTGQAHRPQTDDTAQNAPLDTALENLSGKNLQPPTPEAVDLISVSNSHAGAAGLAVDDELSASAGHDEVNTSAGNDEANGPAGHDEVKEPTGVDAVNESAGGDEMNPPAAREEMNDSDTSDHKDALNTPPLHEEALDQHERRTTIHSSDTASESSRRASEELDNLVNRLGVAHISPQKAGSGPVKGGGFSDVWKGVLQPGDQAVAIKIPRIHTGDGDITRLYKTIAREVVVWTRLRHSSILPFLGVHLDVGNIWLVSPWMQNGLVISYLKHNREADRVYLALEIGRGIAYLHEEGVVHGDLKASNILVDDTGRPLIADFGLSQILEDVLPGQTTTTMLNGSMRWMSPERLQPQLFGLSHAICRTCRSDMYSFAMTLYEIFTLQPPFGTLKDIQVLLAVLNGERPPHPGDVSAQAGLDSQMWAFMEGCWTTDPKARPSLPDLLGFLSSYQPSEEGQDGG